MKVWLIGLSLLLGACVSTPSDTFWQQAQLYGFTESSLSTDDFDLKVYLNSVVADSSGQDLHIYIAGDGSPFFRSRYVTDDPTPTAGTTLELMALDSAPSVLIGRPCYHHPKPTRNCEFKRLWTSHRYSPQVIYAISQAIKVLSKRLDRDKLTLVGFSGGGAIATLLVQHTDLKINKLITLNANLDINAWTKHHHYSQLSGSLNPVDHADDISQTRQHHLIGLRDENVVSSTWLPVFENQPNVWIHRYEGIGHSCCWGPAWQDFINDQAN